MRSILLVSRPGIALAVLALLAIQPSLSAQRAETGDERDLIVLDSGKELHGRVLQIHEPDGIVILQGSSRKRLKRSDIQKIETVRDKLRAFFERREGRDHAAAATHWEMADWCVKQELPHLARVEAYATLARDPNHELAHELLEHKKRGKAWSWRVDKRFMSYEKFVKYTGDIGHPLALRSETFQLETNADLTRATDTLLDLERLYVWFLDEYGAELGLDEVVTPLPFKIYADGEKFPAWSSSGLPYFVPNPYDEKSYTFFAERQRRPTDLFTVAMQHLLYRTLARDADPGDQQGRFCAWLELGLAQWVDSRFRGEPGQVEVGEPDLSRSDAAAALSSDRYSLKNMLHLTLRDHFYGASSYTRRGNSRSITHWAAVHMFTAFLLDEEANPGMRAKVFTFLVVALRDGKGDSSSAFDRAVGMKVEQFEKPWQAWLMKRAGVPGKPR